MKEKIINLKNKFIELIKNNKIVSIVIAAFILIILIVIIVVCSKTQEGNTSGNLINLGFSVQKGGWTYYLGFKDSINDGIYKINSSGSKKEKISDDYGLYLNKSGNYLYFIDLKAEEYNIVKIKTNGEDKQTIENDVDIARFTVINNWIYYFKDDKLYKVKTNGEDKQIILDKSIENYQIVGNWIYYSYLNNGNYIIAKTKTNGEDTQKVDSDASNTFFIDGKNIYYIYENYNEDENTYKYELYRVKISGENKEKIADISGQVDTERINFNSNNLYYIKIDKDGNSAIYKINANGKEETKITDIKTYSTNININNGWIYYTDQNDNGDSDVFRIKTNGENKMALSF